MTATSLSAIGYFLPIFAFLLVFIVVYAILMKTKILGENHAVSLFISFILASFFVVQASLVQFVQEVSGWISTLLVVIFFLLIVVAFAPGDKSLWFLNGKTWFAWIILGVAIGIFILVSSYVFNWVVNWSVVGTWVNSTWFGWVLLVVLALIISKVITKKAG